MYELDSVSGQGYMETKVEYDSFSQAIKLAKEHGIDDRNIQKMVSNKNALKQVIVNGNSSILKKLESNATNVARIVPGWYAVRHIVDKGDFALKVDILLEKDVVLLQRDIKRQRDFAKLDLEAIIPGYIDEVSLELYKVSLFKRARTIISENTGITIPDPELDENTTIRISNHAGKRWVQRVLGINNEIQAEEYRRLHVKEIQEDILQSFSTAQVVWEGEDNVQYHFGENNIMFVIGNNAVITLYEEDFGFSKDINRSIVYQQVDILYALKESLEESSADCQSAIQQLDGEIVFVDSKISVLESELQLFLSKRQTLIAQKEEKSKATKFGKDRFISEFNKLFKKWEM